MTAPAPPDGARSSFRGRQPARRPPCPPCVAVDASSSRTDLPACHACER